MGARRRASMREVADLADVAISSVSRVLSGHPDVSAQMRERVLSAVHRLEYEPDFLAQSLRRGQTLSVGFVLADISNPLMADIVLGAEAVLRGAGYSLLLMNSENDPRMDAQHVRFFQSRRVDGMLLSLASETDPTTLETISLTEGPAVVIDRRLPEELGASAVVNDHGPGMEAAVEHLIDLGHRRIALITGSTAQLPGRERMDAMRAVVARRPERVETIYRPGSFSTEHGEGAAREILSGPDRPTAVIAGGNQLLIGTLKVLREQGLRVGRDISLVTCDEVPLSELYEPPIATIQRETVGLGRVAAELLLGRLVGGEAPRTEVLPTTFLPRPSCASPPA
ncbi:MAG: LacI family DNA-binding transcriptional regulator [Chloroflexi bacterium]|nr:LacI family DNA-binding transcriptional regulator [Chloroflexota bacterium]